MSQFPFTEASSHSTQHHPNPRPTVCMIDYRTGQLISLRNNSCKLHLYLRHWNDWSFDFARIGHKIRIVEERCEYPEIVRSFLRGFQTNFKENEECEEVTCLHPMEGVRYREVVSLAEAARNGGLPTDSIGSPEALEVSFQCEGFDPKIMLDDAISVEMNTWANLSLTTSDLRSISEFPTQALHTWRDERAQTQLRPTESASSLQPAPQTVPTIPTEEMSLDSQAEDINRRREERVQAWLDQLILKFESEI